MFNNSAGPNNLEVTVSMQSVEPGVTYDIYLFVDGVWYDGALVGTITTNMKGNANFHMNGLIDQGEHTLAIDIAYTGSLSDIYETPDIHSGGGVVMTFK